MPEPTHEQIMVEVESVRSLVKGVGIGFTALVGVIVLLAGLWASSLNGKVEQATKPAIENGKQIQANRESIARNTATAIERTSRLERIERSISEVSNKIDKLNERLFEKRYP